MLGLQPHAGSVSQRFVCGRHQFIRLRSTLMTRLGRSLHQQPALPADHRPVPVPIALDKPPSDEVLRLWRSAEAVCFDVDSTFCEDESIDEIAAFLGVGEEVAALTARAMGGSIKFQDALAMRLGVMQPTRQQLDTFLQRHPARLSKGIPELVQRLHAQGKGVFLVSGGFRAVIHPIADSLGIPLSNVYANTIRFNSDGSYCDFDPEEYTSQSGGKAAAIREIKAKHGYSTIVMVGDGATDLEARQPGGADLFIGYGGVVLRPNIAALADWYVMDIHLLLDALQA